MVAAHHRKVPLRPGKPPSLQVVHPSSVDAQGHVVLALARNRASVTADTSATVQQKPEARHGYTVSQLAVPISHQMRQLLTAHFGPGIPGGSLSGVPGESCG